MKIPGARDSNPKWLKRLADGGTVPLPQPNPIRQEADKGIDTLRSEPPVTVMDDVIGRFSKSKGQDNAFRDAIRERARNSASKYYNSSDALMKKYDDR